MNAKHALIDHILVPLDGSQLAEQAIPYSEALVAPGGKITLFRVIPHGEAIQDPIGGLLMSEQEVLTRYRVQAGQESVTAMERRAKPGAPNMEVVIEPGDAAEEILRAARERGIGMIVMASKGRGAFGRLALGSVTDRVARTADVPVLIIRPDDALPDLSLPILKRLIVPIDGSERSLEAVPTAEILAQRLQASVHLVTIVDFGKAAPSALAYGAAFSQELYDEVMGDIEREARNVLETCATGLDARGVVTTWEITTGTPAGALIEVASPGDLIVMTTHGRGGVKRWLLGSVAEKLVRHSPVPLVIVPASSIQNDVK